MANILPVTPFTNVDDLEGTVRFWRDLLGFTVVIHADSYAYVEREGAGVRIMENGPNYRGQRPIGKPFGVYFDVRDVDALAAEITARLSQFPEATTHGPVDQSYGQREFMVMSPSGHVVVFGQAIHRMPLNTPAA